MTAYILIKARLSLPDPSPSCVHFPGVSRSRGRLSLPSPVPLCFAGIGPAPLRSQGISASFYWRSQSDSCIYLFALLYGKFPQLYLLTQGQQIFFYEGPRAKYFRLCRTRGLRHNHLTLPPRQQPQTAPARTGAAGSEAAAGGAGEAGFGLQAALADSCLSLHFCYDILYVSELSCFVSFILGVFFPPNSIYF